LLAATVVDAYHGQSMMQRTEKDHAAVVTGERGAELGVDRHEAGGRILAVLEVLAARADGVSPKELSQALGLHLSTCYRLLNTLAAAGYARRAVGGIFQAGGRIAYLHQGYLASLDAAALPFVHALQQATGELAVLLHWEGDNVVCTAADAGSDPGAVPWIYPGLAAPAHAVASGRALLAGLPAPRLEAYLARCAAQPSAAFPLTNPVALRAELARIRAAGYAMDQGDLHPGLGCLAAAVGDASSPAAAAIAILAPCSRLTQDKPALVALLRAVAQAINAVPIAAPGPEDVNQAKAARAAIAETLASLAGGMSRVG
jgi:DNA-binding IclR family transcriptional regulator